MNDFFGRIWSKKKRRQKFQIFDQNHRVFSHDVTAAILMSQNNETAAMLVSQTSPVGVELFSSAHAFFCSNEFAQMLATLVKTLYRLTPEQKCKFCHFFNLIFLSS